MTILSEHSWRIALIGGATDRIQTYRQPQALIALLRVFDLRAKLIGLYSPEKHQIAYEEPDYDLKESVKDITEMIDLGVKYAEEHGIETAFTTRKKENESRKPWEPESH